MCIDINPLGIQMHLRQIERDAEHRHRLEQMAEDSNCRDQSELTAGKSWVAQLAGMFLPLRPVS